MKYIDAWMMVEQAVVSLVGELVVRRSSSRAVGAGKTVAARPVAVRWCLRMAGNRPIGALIGKSDTSPGYAAGGDVLIVQIKSRARSIRQVEDSFDDAANKTQPSERG